MADDEQQAVVESKEVEDGDKEPQEGEEEEKDDPPYKQVADFGWSDDGPEDARLITPCGIALSSKGDVFVADFGAANVKVYNKDGEFQQAISYTSEQFENFYPGDVAVGPDDEFIYVIGAGNFDDWDNNAIIKFNYSGEPQKEIVHDKLKGAISIAVNNRGYINVIDRSKRRLVVFDHDGKYVKAIGGRGCELGKFNTPMYVRFTKRDFCIVSDLASRIQVFDPDGSVTRLFQTVTGPTGICVDDDDHIIAGGAGIHVLSLKGDVIGCIGDRHNGPNTRGVAAAKIDGIPHVFAVCCKCSLPEGSKSYVAVYQYDADKLKEMPRKSELISRESSWNKLMDNEN
ncbi:uncharacterized protein LOC144438562 [Glandiceps talaboti]